MANDRTHQITHVVFDLDGLLIGTLVRNKLAPSVDLFTAALRHDVVAFDGISFDLLSRSLSN